MENTHFYSIGGHGVSLTFTEWQANSASLVASMSPFETSSEHCPKLAVSMIVDDDLRPLPTSGQTLVRDFDTGNGKTRVDCMTDGQYQYVCRDIFGRQCCLIIASPDFSVARCALRGSADMRTFGLTNAMMLVYAYRTSYFSTLLLHASVVRYRDRAYAFTAKSGTGKSTHVARWLENIEGCDMINDDNPIIRVEQGDAFLYGSPWSGKTPCYRPLRVRLGTVAQIKRAEANSCEPMSKMAALGMFLSGCSSMRWDKRLSDNLYATLSLLLPMRTFFTVNCLPDADAAFTACRVLSAQDS